VKELSLFSGVGGGLLASKYFLGWETIGYVEYEEYCQKVLKQRIADGLLDAAPIFGDIRAFISEGYAEAYKGMVDVITGGFPCQPFSVAGKGLGEDDPRNMWPSTIECIRIIRPLFAFLENVPNLLTHEYARRIFGDLAESGYDVRWRVLSAAEVGAPHFRDRIWIVAHAHDKYRETSHPTRSGETPKEIRGQNSCDVSSPLHAAETADSLSKRIQGGGTQEVQGKSRLSWGEGLRRLEDLRDRPDIPTPLFRGVDDGIPNYMDRIKAIGNGQVPQCMARAWELLTEDIIGGEPLKEITER